MSLLPSRPDTSAAEESAPRVVGVDSDDADQLISALSSTTARRILAELHEDPKPPSQLADEVDTSLQNVQYHLENLADAGAIEVIDTVYSEKGREMDVYAPADRPLVIFAGDETSSSTIRAALSRLLGGLGILLFGSLLVQQWVGDGIPLPVGGMGSGESAAAPTETPTPTQTATETATEAGDIGIAEATETATEVPEATETVAPEVTQAAQTGVDAAASGVPPGLLFFAGGAVVLAVVAALWYIGR